MQKTKTIWLRTLAANNRWCCNCRRYSVCWTVISIAFRWFVSIPFYFGTYSFPVFQSVQLCFLRCWLKKVCYRFSCLSEFDLQFASKMDPRHEWRNVIQRMVINELIMRKLLYFCDRLINCSSSSAMNGEMFGIRTTKNWTKFMPKSSMLNWVRAVSEVVV